MSEELQGAYNKAEGLRLQAQATILDLQDQLSHLQKLCEEQRAQLALLKDLVLDDVPHQYQKRLLEVLK